jgi:hypothetical protein
MTAPSTPTDISGELLDRVHDTHLEWFGKHYDLEALDAVLAAAAAEQLEGDPPWLLLVGGPGWTKTETLLPLKGAGAVVVSTLSGEAALLSGTSKRDRAKSANGGLLRGIGGDGQPGLLVIKDVTSILSMNRDTRAIILGALREVYDGSWYRDVGTDGGQRLTWEGRIVVVGAVTTQWDSHHEVIAAMGDRFTLVRLDDGLKNGNRQEVARQAMRNVKREQAMRQELAEQVSGLLGYVNPADAVDLGDRDMDILGAAADIVTQARTAVERDFNGNPAFAHALEAPTRLAKQLTQIVRGGVALGMTRSHAMLIALRVARDTMPPRRLRVLADVAEHPWSPTADVVTRLQLPRQTVDRTLIELHLLNLLKVDSIRYGEKDRWIYQLANQGHQPLLEMFTRNVSTPGKGDQ